MRAFSFSLIARYPDGVTRPLLIRAPVRPARRHWPREYRHRMDREKASEPE